MIRVIFYLLLFGLSKPAFCLDINEWNLAKPQLEKCEALQQRQHNACLADEYKIVDKKLNKLYRKLYSSLADPKLLQKSQKDWLRFRDSYCKFSIGTISGSEYSYAVNACFIDLTKKRILDIQSVWVCNGCPEFKPEIYESGKWQ